METGAISTCVASQSVRRSETLAQVMPERPANGGVLQFGYRSPGSEIGLRGTEIVDSLWPIFEIFPFPGDCGRRPVRVALRGRSGSVCCRGLRLFARDRLRLYPHTLADDAS
jgi:hypothetical protein